MATAEQLNAVWSKRIDDLGRITKALKLEAQLHAQEARTANATIAEIYQLCSGGTGEPGNWHGVEPVREKLAALEAKLAQRVPEWHGLVEGERAQIVDAICEYGTGFVTPLYAVVEGIERKLMERNAAPAAPEQQEPTPMEPFLLRDLSQELGVSVPFLSHQIACNGLGSYSTNMALPRHVATEIRKIHKQIEGFAQAPNAQQAEAQEPCVLMPLESINELMHCNGMSVWVENPQIYPPYCDGEPLVGFVPLFTRPQPAQLQARIAELESQLAAAAKDAERYQWLRSAWLEDPDAGEDVAWTPIMHSCDESGVDADIDAAIARTKEQPV